MARDLLAFCVILADRQVFPDTSFGVSQPALRFGRKHDPKVRRSKPNALIGSGRVYTGYIELFEGALWLSGNTVMDFRADMDDGLRNTLDWSHLHWMERNAAIVEIREQVNQIAANVTAIHPLVPGLADGNREGAV